MAPRVQPEGRGWGTGPASAGDGDPAHQRQRGPPGWPPRSGHMLSLGRRRVPLARPRVVPWRAGKPGVTLLEMLLVVGLLAILAAVALPRFATSATWAAQGEVSARKVVAAMRLARRMAVDHGATNATGYRVECAGSTCRTFDLGAGAYYATPTTLADGWAFEGDGWTVIFNPYGGAQIQGGQPAYAAISGSAGRWLVHLESATGYVWYEGG